MIPLGSFEENRREKEREREKGLVSTNKKSLIDALMMTMMRRNIYTQVVQQEEEVLINFFLTLISYLFDRFFGSSLKKGYNWWESGYNSEDKDAEEEQLIRCDGTAEYIHGDLSRTGRYGRAIRKELNVRSTNRNEKWNF